MSLFVKFNLILLVVFAAALVPVAACPTVCCSAARAPRWSRTRAS